MYKIEKDIPLTKSLNKYPLMNMEIGDSFLIPFENRKAARLRQSYLIVAIKKYSRQIGIKAKYASRVSEEGLRVWRIL